MRMDGAMRATAGAVISAAEAICTGFQGGGNRRHSGESAGPETASGPQGSHLVVCRRSGLCRGVGRANWTFFGSDRSGKTAAVLRSFVTFIVCLHLRQALPE